QDGIDALDQAQRRHRHHQPDPGPPAAILCIAGRLRKQSREHGPSRRGLSSAPDLLSSNWGRPPPDAMIAGAKKLAAGNSAELTVAAGLAEELLALAAQAGAAPVAPGAAR